MAILLRISSLGQQKNVQHQNGDFTIEL